MKKMELAFSFVLFVCLGAISVFPTMQIAIAGPSAIAESQVPQQPPFVEIPGQLEFSGQMIARPLQIEANAEQVQQIMDGFDIIEYVPQTDEYIFSLNKGDTEHGISQELMATGIFQYVDPNWTCYPLECPNDPGLGNQWHHDTDIMQSCDGWSLHTGDPTTVVGICDTGLRVSHEEFQQHRQTGYNAVDREWENQGGDISDINGHGTGTSGCAAANGNNSRGGSGVGWDLGHRILKVSNSQGGGAFMSDLVHAARTSVEAGDKVANVSYSGVTEATVRTTATYIKSIGGLLVWSAGNSGQNLNFANRDNDDLLVIGATTSSDTRAGFSNYGQYVDFMAPGQSVYTTSRSSDSGYGNVDGTSFSAPLTAGLCALIFSSNPSLTPDEVEAIVKATCDDLGSNGVDDTFGYGRINVFNAMDVSAVSIGFSYPEGLPTMISPKGGDTVRVHVINQGSEPQPGSGLFHYNIGNGWAETPMNEISNNIYDAVFPATDCGTVVDFYFSSQTTEGDIAQDPKANQPTYATRSAAFATVLYADNYEEDTGWTRSGNADNGLWHRRRPAAHGSGGAPTSDADGSGRCYLTNNNDGDSDIDHGSTIITSPRIAVEIAEGEVAMLSYYRWFNNSEGLNPEQDPFFVHISNDNGNTWTRVEKVGPAGSEVHGGWYHKSFNISEIIDLTRRMRIKVMAKDNDPGSTVEAAFDGFEISVLQCEDSNAANLVAYNVVTGTRISGVLDDLKQSDDSRMQIRSGFGTLFTELHKMDLVVDALTTVETPASIDFSIEGRIDEPGGSARISLFNWNSGRFESVGQFPIGQSEELHEIDSISAANYVDVSGLIKASIKTIVFVPFLAFTFNTYVDHIQISVN